MPYVAYAINVMIGSPGDVQEEHTIIRKAIDDWNAAHSFDRQLVLIPLNWRTHASTGASIDKSHNDTDPALFLYIWVRGSRGQGSAQVEEDLDKLLGEQRIKYQAAELGWYKGTAIFGKIPLSKRVNAKTFEIDEEKLLDEVSDFLKTIGKKDAVKLFEI
jgi:hypothetical protein